MNYDYPILNKIFNFYNIQEHGVKELYLVCCQHLLEPQLKMIEFLIKFGFSPEKILILEKVYSSNEEIIKELKSLGVKVVRFEFNGNSFDEEHKKNCEYIFNIVPNNSKSILIDDGAQLIKTFYERIISYFNKHGLSRVKILVVGLGPIGWI